MKIEKPLLLWTLITMVPKVLENFDAKGFGLKFCVKALFLIPNTMTEKFVQYSKILVNLGISSESHQYFFRLLTPLTTKIRFGTLVMTLNNAIWIVYLIFVGSKCLFQIQENECKTISIKINLTEKLIIEYSYFSGERRSVGCWIPNEGWVKLGCNEKRRLPFSVQLVVSLNYRHFVWI